MTKEDGNFGQKLSLVVVGRLCKTPFICWGLTQTPTVESFGSPRTPASVSKGRLAPISYVRVQMLCGIVRQRLQDCLIASQARRSLNRTSNTMLIFRDLLWRALLSIPRAAHEHLR